MGGSSGGRNGDVFAEVLVVVKLAEYAVSGGGGGCHENHR